MAALTSRTVRFHQYGEPLDVLRQETIDVAEPGADRIRVRVIAAGLNPADWELCRGFAAGTLPRGIGLDVAGRVESVGSEVTGTRVGDLVFGVPDWAVQPSAGVADVAILRHWFAVPDGLDPVQASVLTMAVQTASWTLDAVGVGEGGGHAGAGGDVDAELGTGTGSGHAGAAGDVNTSTLLVHGAGGTAGYAAVQMAVRRGVRVIATAGQTYAADLEGFGATVTPYGDGMVQRVRDIAGGDVDLVLDMAPANPGSIPALIEIAGAPERVVTISNHAEARSLGARVNLDLLRSPQPLVDLMPPYAESVARGEFRMPIARTFDFAEWRDAVDLSLSGRAHGKIAVLTGAN